MVEDARFEDAADRPVRVVAQDGEDLQVISSLIQDAVFPIAEMSWKASKRRFAVLVNRMRWEDQVASARPNAVERVRSLLVFDDVARVSSQGIDRAETDLVFSALALDWQESTDGAGTITLTLAGDGAVALSVECINVTLQDVTKPYLAPSGKVPEHPA